MKKLLNTLYVQTQGSYLRQEGETVVVERERAVVARIPIHTLSGIVCFGNVLCSPFLLGLCGERGVHVSFLSEHGRFLARVEGPVSGNVLLRIAQMRAAGDPQHARDLAASFVAGKILNARTVLQRRLRDHGDDPACSHAVIERAALVPQLRKAAGTDGVRGVEGAAEPLVCRVATVLAGNVVGGKQPREDRLVRKAGADGREGFARGCVVNAVLFQQDGWLAERYVVAPALVAGEDGG